MPRIGSEKEKYYRSLKYEDLKTKSEGTMREAFGAFVPFVSRLSGDIDPFFKGAGPAIRAAHEMAQNILRSAGDARYGNMTDREVLACLTVQKASQICMAALTLCANYVGDDTEEVLEEEKYMTEVDPVRDALKEVILALRIIALPLTNS